MAENIRCRECDRYRQKAKRLLGAFVGANGKGEIADRAFLLRGL